MKNYTEYDPPLTEGTAGDHGYRKCCEGFTDAYLCTRKAGHPGRHEAAGLRNQVFASWEDDE